MKSTIVKSSKLGTNWTAEYHISHQERVAHWTADMGKADATHCSAEYAVANLILGRMRGYRQNSIRRDHDTVELAAALEAYAALLQRHGVKVHDDASLTDLDEAQSKFP